MRPNKQKQRDMLIIARDQLQERGFEAEINLAALDVQEADDKELSKRRADLEETRDNAYKAAKEMEKRLKALGPAPAAKK